ncbi:hypothetical protein ELS19_14280 [Halogeometricum borinquense]|uniref:DUF2188 domain-containing protein n=1 Tax=Halogeometricum borinquense TaxID=60847 RepID=A0A482TE66_9EURY|nr:hypothetical protein [Halogeometricum borinquense]RYJ15002.1 hypothetical protein ELS19_14280 [Halogeometricum borinquense]
MSLRSFLTSALGFGGGSPQYTPGEVTWSVAYDVDDYDGPGWYLTAKGPEVHETEGPFRSKRAAIDAARERGSEGDELTIWDKDALEPEITTIRR